MLIRLDKIKRGVHLESVVVSEDNVPNGAVVALNGYGDFDTYKSKKPADITADDLVMVVEEFMNKTGYEQESKMVFAKNSVVRAYHFEKNDVITLTIDGITGATNVSTDMVGKFVVPVNASYGLAISATKTGNLCFKVEALETMDGSDALVLKVL